MSFTHNAAELFTVKKGSPSYFPDSKRFSLRLVTFTLYTNIIISLNPPIIE